MSSTERDASSQVARVRPLRVAALVKQIPAVEMAELNAAGRLQRVGLPLQMNDYCRRAVAKGFELAMDTGGSLTVITLGPPSAEEVLREALAFGAHRAVHVCDPAFAGSDTYATASALARVIERTGPYDLVLTGRNSIDADTGQVPPGVAELLGFPFAADVRHITLNGAEAELGLEHDDEWVDATVTLPALLSCAERLCDPCKVRDADRRAAVDGNLIEVVDAAALGRGPWGQAGSLTSVGAARPVEMARLHRRLDGSLDRQIAELFAAIRERSGGDCMPETTEVVADCRSEVDGPVIAVVVEPGRDRAARELLGEAAALAQDVAGRVVAVGPDVADHSELSTWGADAAVCVEADHAGEPLEAEVADALTGWCRRESPWAVLGPSTAWGREVLGRLAVAVHAGLTGDAIDLRVSAGRLVAHKPAFGGTVLVDIVANSPMQMATVRAGTLPLRMPRMRRVIRVEHIRAEHDMRLVVSRRARSADFDLLATANVVLGVGQGFGPGDDADLRDWAAAMGAELAATRKVTDFGWVPRARQIGITGLSISPSVYFAVATSGRFNHMAGVRAASTVVAINTDPAAEVFGRADFGIVADAREVLPLIVERIRVEGVPWSCPSFQP